MEHRPLVGDHVQRDISRHPLGFCPQAMVAEPGGQLACHLELRLRLEEGPGSSEDIGENEAHSQRVVCVTMALGLAGRLGERRGLL